MASVQCLCGFPRVEPIHIGYNVLVFLFFMKQQIKWQYFFQFSQNHSMYIQIALGIIRFSYTAIVRILCQTKYVEVAVNFGVYSIIYYYETKYCILRFTPNQGTKVPSVIVSNESCLKCVKWQWFPRILLKL